MQLLDYRGTYFFQSRCQDLIQTKLVQVRSEISNDHVDFIKNLIFQLVPSFSAVQNMKRKIDIAKGQILLVVWNTLWQKRTSSSTTWRNVECLLNNNRITSQHNAFNNNMKQFLKLLEKVVYKICCHQCTHLMSQLITSKATGIFNPHLLLHFRYLLLRETLLHKSVQHFSFKL